MNRNRWIPVVAAIVLAVIVGGFAYNAGVAHGIAQSGKFPAAPPYPYPYYGWHGGFGFFFAPFFFIIAGVLILRGLTGGGHWHHRHHCRYSPEGGPAER